MCEEIKCKNRDKIKKKKIRDMTETDKWCDEKEKNVRREKIHEKIRCENIFLWDVDRARIMIYTHILSCYSFFLQLSYLIVKNKNVVIKVHSINKTLTYL